MRKKLVATSLTLLYAMTLSIQVYALSLPYWYSDSSKIGKWSYNPTVEYLKIDTRDTFAFATGIHHGAQIWGEALGRTFSVNSSPTPTSTMIFYGGTKSQIDALMIFPPVPSTVLGLTRYTRVTPKGTHTHNGVPKGWDQIDQVHGYVVSRLDSSSNNVIKTASHEIGHALGWYGHPQIYQSTWVMQQGALENKVLSTSEKNHLAQIY